MTSYLYDIEILPNCFTAIFLETGQSELINLYIQADIQNKNELKKEILSKLKYKIFTIYDGFTNDLTKLYNFLLIQKTIYGYNNYGYDDIVIDYIYTYYKKLNMLSVVDLLKDLKNINDYLIGSDYWYTVRQNLEIKRNKSNISIDLQRLNYLDRSKISLKQVSINLKWYNIQEYIMPDYTLEQAIELYGEDVNLEYVNKIKSFNRKVHISELPNLIKYNFNDVFVTNKLLEVSIKELESRLAIEKQYGIRVLSDSRSSAATKIIKHLYSKYTGLSYDQFVDLRTWRRKIKFFDIINPDISFKSNELSTFLNKLKTIIISNDISFNEIITFNGKHYSLGVGGIHSKDIGAIYKETDDFKIIDCDVNSYYPNAIVNYRIKPLHISSTFIDILNDILKLRMYYKNLGDKKNAEIYKIIINAVYGKYGDSDSFLKDDYAMYSVTINNQLYLLQLIELYELNGISVISANTDGVTCYVHKSKLDIYYKLSQDWQYNTKFQLEFNNYSTYVRTSVNSYIAKYSETDEIKKKGEFDFDKYKDLSSGYNAPIIPYAIYKYFIYNIPITTTVNNHTDILDFCISQKTGSSFVNEYQIVENGEVKYIKLQKNIRFYASKKGGVLVKRSTSTNNTISILKNQYVTILNKIENKNIGDYNIDYNYYISRCRDIIDRVYNIKTNVIKKSGGTLFDNLDYV